MEDFFEKTQIDQCIPILLIDSSGSVLVKFDTLYATIFDKMEAVISNIPAEKFRMIFWNSDKITDSNFPNGVLKLPHVVEKKYVKQSMFLIRSKITKNCLTFPHVAFNAIDSDWIDNVNPTHIYFITDGQMGYGGCSNSEMANLKSLLASNIENIFKKYGNVHLHIISVEADKLNYDNYETVCNAAGGDVYNVIQNNGLTKYISEFVSYSLNNLNGYKHIDTIIPPTGFVSYESKYFSQAKIPQFIQFIHNEIQKHAKDEMALLRIVQNLSKTAIYLIKDKNDSVSMNILSMLCHMFKDTCIDISMVKFMLADAVALEKIGKSIVLSEYKVKLQNLYKEAQKLLTKNAFDAMNIGTKFITLPINNQFIIVGSSTLVRYVYKNKKQSFINGAVRIENKYIPVLPMELDNVTALNEQCIRQFVRTSIPIIGVEKINIMDDIVIYLFMGLMVRAVLSDIPESAKSSYRKLATIMLKKKYNNTEISMYDRISSGELPIPNNGKIEAFYAYMQQVKSMLKLTRGKIDAKVNTNVDAKVDAKIDPNLDVDVGVGIAIDIDPLTMWYLLCLALDDQKIINKQLLHCKESLKKNFNQYDQFDQINLSCIQDHISKLTLVEIPITQTYDYNCIVTLDNIQDIGGYIIKPHPTISGHSCCPTYVISEKGHSQMINGSVCVCPICYNSLTIQSFERVGPKTMEIVKIFGK